MFLIFLFWFFGSFRKMVMAAMRAPRGLGLQKLTKKWPTGWRFCVICYFETMHSNLSCLNHLPLHKGERPTKSSGCTTQTVKIEEIIGYNTRLWRSLANHRSVSVSLPRDNIQYSTQYKSFWGTVPDDN